MRLDPVRLAAFANDVAWAFGLTDAAARRLVFEAPRSERAARHVVAQLRGALVGARPAPRAPSVGEALAALDVPRATPRAKKRALAELVELIAQGTHHRAKRQERARVLGEMILVFDLEGALGVAPCADADAALAAIARAVGDTLAR